MASLGNGSQSNLMCVGGNVIGGGGHSSSWGGQMDALVSDLSLALEESQQSQRRRRPARRRANQQPNGHGMSDYSSSSAEEALQTGGANSQDNKSSMHLTDTDEEELSPGPRTSRYRAPRPLRPPPGAGLVESDSVNESFSPAPRPANIRRKPKCKRLALECGGEGGGPLRAGSLQRWRPAIPVTNTRYTLDSPTSRRAPRAVRQQQSSVYTPALSTTVCGGKRKRSRDGGCSEGAGADDEAEDTYHRVVAAMDTSGTRRGGGECSVSSDDSDGGAGPCGATELFTCDEGREADDEQSDWFTEGPGPVYGIPTTPHTMPYDDGSLTGSSGVGPCNSRQRFQKIKERLMRREIRAGRRRLRDRRPGCVLTGSSSVSESVTRFLQDPLASELQLRPSSVAECDQLQRLAQLYSLHLRVADDASQQMQQQPTSCTVTKTCGTTIEASSFPWGLPTPLSDASKKRRKTPTPPMYAFFSEDVPISADGTPSALTNDTTSASNASTSIGLDQSFCEEVEMVG